MDAIKNVFTLIGNGIKDCFIGFLALRRVWSLRKKPMKYLHSVESSNVFNGEEKNRTVSQILLQCCALNGAIFLFADYLFYVFLSYINLPLKLVFDPTEINSIWLYMETCMFLFFVCVWTFPQFLISRILNFVWYQEIANLILDNAQEKKTNIFISISYSWGDAIESAVFQMLFFFQSCVVSFIPIKAVGHFLYIFHLCLLYSMYAFEYKWANMGWPLKKRLLYLDKKWPYFIGFSLPLALLTSYSASVIQSICIFSILFPLCVISGSAMFSSKMLQYNQPLHIFRIVMWVNDKTFSGLYHYIHHRTGA